MQKFFKKKTVIAVIVILVLTLIFSAISMVRPGGTSPASNAVGTIVTPIQSLFSTVKNSVGSFFYALFHCLEFQRENEILNTQIDKLEQDIADTSSLEAENQRLLELLDLKNAQGERQTVAAQVITREQSNWYSMCTINKGTADGIQKNDAVIAVGGLVGYVSEAGINWAKVITIYDESCSVASIISRTGDQGITEGNYALTQNGQVQMSFLPDDAAISKGDFVETSGMGGVYPSGILIGKVVDISKDSQNLSISAIVEPAVDFHRLREVLVITN